MTNFPSSINSNSYYGTASSSPLGLGYSSDTSESLAAAPRNLAPQPSHGFRAVEQDQSPNLLSKIGSYFKRLGKAILGQDETETEQISSPFPVNQAALEPRAQSPLETDPVLSSWPQPPTPQRMQEELESHERDLLELNQALAQVADGQPNRSLTASESPPSATDLAQQNPDFQRLWAELLQEDGDNLPGAFS